MHVENDAGPFILCNHSITLPIDWIMFLLKLGDIERFLLVYGIAKI